MSSPLLPWLAPRHNSVGYASVDETSFQLFLSNQSCYSNLSRSVTHQGAIHSSFIYVELLLRWHIFPQSVKMTHLLTGSYSFFIHSLFMLSCCTSFSKSVKMTHLSTGSFSFFIHAIFLTLYVELLLSK